MVTSTGKATWEGTLKEGNGNIELASSGIFTGPFTWASRFGKGAGEGKTNPEELIGAAHAGCYAMFLSALLSGNDTPPTRLNATSKVTIGEGPAITLIELSVEGSVEGIDDAKFQELAKDAKEKCPVSKALAGVGEIILSATLN
ncbi:MAG: OsmC family peroxiredoxin [Candidatus Heimdallarchaeota archaeon]|nr:OsmC family peroxiredoxin [Candidatus Heimdallarchaeota archaeon]